jgi:hypothetical protein
MSERIYFCFCASRRVWIGQLTAFLHRAICQPSYACGAVVYSMLMIRSISSQSARQAGEIG